MICVNDRTVCFGEEIIENGAESETELYKMETFSPIHTVLFQKCGRSVSKNQNNTNEKEHILQTVQN